MTEAMTRIVPYAEAKSVYRILASTGAIRHVYATPDYLNLISSLTKAPLRAVIDGPDNQPAGALIFSDNRGPSGRVLNSLPFFGSHGGCVVACGADVRSVKTRLLDAFRDEALSKDVLAATVIEPLGETDSDLYERILCPTEIDRRTSQVTWLRDAAGHLGLPAALSAQTAQNIRRALRDGVTVRQSDLETDMKILCDLHQTAMNERGGAVKPWEFFRGVLDLPTSMWRLWVAERSGRASAALLVLCHGEAVEYFVPATRGIDQPSQPLALCLAEGLKWAMAAGYPAWNWGGTWASQTTLLRFKRKWGGEDVSYAYHVLASDPRSVALSLRNGEASFHPFHYLYPFDRLPAIGA